MYSTPFLLSHVHYATCSEVQSTERPTEAPDEKCSSDEFMCGDGTCIPLSQRCDWTVYHCADGSDEFDCRTLPLVAHCCSIS